MRLGFVLSSLVTVLIIVYVIFSLYVPQQDLGGVEIVGGELLLPLPRKITIITVEEAILLRKSIREWKDSPITVEQLSMILWASQGVVEDVDGWLRRASPSAGATYPLEVYVVIGERGVSLGNESYVEAGVYKYDYVRHSLKLIKEGDFRDDLWRATLRQDWVREAPVSLVICAVYERTTWRYGERGVRYVHIEVGHVGQNIYLMSTALGLGTVAVGAFHDDEVARVVNAQRDERPLYVFPVGVPLRPYKTDFRELQELYSRLRR
ncbi:MAG: SagB/ThcOx family dehydrogenase [Desulfurococcaceae archaeon TW002]